MQTEHAKRMDSAGEEASLNSPELPWIQLYLKRRTRIQLRRRVCFTGLAPAAVTGVLAILILAAGRVSGIDLVQVPISVNCTEGQDCILSCTFYYTAGSGDEKSAVIWRRAETDHIVHRYHDNTDQLADQFPQYVNRTSLFDSELQRGNASLLLRRVTEEDAGEYRCFVSTPRLYGSGLTEVVVVPAQPTTAPAHVTVPSSVKCTEGQDCILSCTFNYTAGGWDEESAVIWRQAETDHIVHSYHDNTDQLADQSPQYVNRTSLFDSELQRGNASLLLRRVREEDAGEYECSVYTPRLYGSGLTEVVVVPAQPTTAPAHVQVLSSVKCSEGQDCILSCSFDYVIAGDWKKKSGVTWRRAETDRIVHSNNNREQLVHQLPQYVSRTSLFDSELQRGNASLLLRRVREEDAGKYRCFVKGMSGSGLTEVGLVSAQPRTAAWVSGAVLCVIAGLCVGL